MSNKEPFRDRLDDLFSDVDHPEPKPENEVDSSTQLIDAEDDEKDWLKKRLGGFGLSSIAISRDQVGWEDYLNAIDRSERIGFEFDQEKISFVPRKSGADSEYGQVNDNAIKVPLQIGEEILGVLQLEGDDDLPEETSELLGSIAQQVTQHIDNLRLLAQAEQYRSEAEKATRRLTHESWQEYLQSEETTGKNFIYDQDNVEPIDPETLESKIDGENLSDFALSVRGQSIGKIVIADPAVDVEKTNELISTVINRLTGHIENLRLLDDTERSRQQLDKRASELESVAEVSTTVSTVLDPENLLQSVADLTRDRFGLYHAHIYIFDKNQKSLALETGAGEVGAQMVAEGWSIQLTSEKSLVAQAARTRKGIIVNDVRSDPDYLTNPLLPETRSEMAVPMIVGEQVVGVLDVQSDRQDYFTDEDVLIISTLASQVAVAYENANSFQRVQQAADEMALLFEASRTMSIESLDVLDVARTVARAFVLMMPRFSDPHFSPECEISLYDQDQNTLHTIIKVSLDDDQITLVEDTEGVVSNCEDYPNIMRVVGSNQPSIAHASDPNMDKVELAYMQKYELASDISLPLTVKGEIIGTIDLTTYENELHLTQDELNLAMTLANQAAIAIDNADSYERIQQAADEMELLFDVSRELSLGHLEVQDIANTVAYLFVTKMPKFSEVRYYPECEINLYDRDKNILTAVFEVALEDDQETYFEDVTGDVFLCTDFPAFMGAIENLKPWIVHISDPDADPLELDYMKKYEYITNITLPMAVKGELLGTIELVTYEEELHLSQDEINLAMTLANQAAVAMENALSYERVQKAAEEISLLFDVSRAIAGAPVEIDEIALVVARKFIDVLGIPECSINLFDPDQYNVKSILDLFINEQGEEQIREIDNWKSFSLDEYPDTTKTIANMQPAVIHASDPDLAPSELALMKKYDITTSVVIPLIAKRLPIGYLELESPGDERVYSQEELNLAMTLANQAAVSLDNAKLFQEAQSRAAQMEALADIGKEVTSTLELEHVLEKIANLAYTTLNANSSAVYIPDDNGRELKPISVFGEEAQETLNEMVTIGEGIIGSIAATKIGELVNYSDDDPRAILVSGTEWSGKFHMMVSPILSQNELRGMLVTWREGDDQMFSVSEFDFSESMAQQAAVAIENAELFENAQARAAEMEALAEVAKDVTSTLELQSVLERISLQAKEILNASTSAVYIPDAIGDKLTAIVAFGDESEKIRGYTIAREGEGVIASVARSKVGERVNDSALDPRVTIVPGTEREEHEHLMVSPVLSQEELRGLLVIWRNGPDQLFIESEFLFLESLAQQAAIAIDNALSYDRIQKAAEEMRLLFDTSANLNQEMLDPKEIGNLVAQVAGQAMQVSQVTVSIYDPEENTLQSIADYDIFSEDSNIQPERVGTIYHLDQYPLTQNAIQTMQPFVVQGSDSDGDPNEIAYFEQAGLKTVVSLPMVAKGQTVGLIELESYDDELHFTQDELNLGMIIAGQAGTAIENARLFAETQTRAAELATVAKVSTAAATILEPQALLQSVVDLTQYSFELYHVAVYLVGAGGHSLNFSTGAGKVGPKLLAEGHSLKLGEKKSAIAEAARSRSVVIVTNASEDENFLHHPLLPNTLSAMTVPMIVADELIGVFNVESDQVNHFSVADEVTFTTLASQTAVALRNAQLYAEQMETVERLRELDELKSSFLANMSHELRTPLNSIIGFTQVIMEGLDGPLTEDMEMDLGLIDKSGKHLLALINDVLDMAKIESGKLVLAIERILLTKMLADVLRTVQPLADDKSLSLEMESGVDDAMGIMADSVRLQQILMNLMGNAIKFTDYGGVTVITKKTKKNVLISIKDTGIGIPEGKLETIFEAFSQVDTSTTRKAGGTGLGLPISRRLVEMHGGRLWAESNGVPGEGSTFQLELPIKAIVPEDNLGEDK